MHPIRVSQTTARSQKSSSAYGSLLRLVRLRTDLYFHQRDRPLHHRQRHCCCSPRTIATSTRQEGVHMPRLLSIENCSSPPFRRSTPLSSDLPCKSPRNCATSSTTAPRRSFMSSSISSSSASSTSVPAPFDRPLKVLQRGNAARGHRRRLERLLGEAAAALPHRGDYDYMRDEMARRLVDRLQDVAYQHRPDGFPLALDVGSGPGFVHRALCDGMDDEDEGGDDPGSAAAIGGVRKLVQLEASSDWLHRDDNRPVPGGHHCEPFRLVGDEDPGAQPWPFPDGTFDLVISSGSLHWVNDLPALFSEAYRVLKPDGCFLCNFVGGDSLPELRQAFALAELERDGGASSRVGPFVPLPELGRLMQRAGFALPTLDVDTVQLSYPSAAVAMEHLQRMGESHAGRNRRPRTPLDVFLAASCLYDGLFSLDNDGSDHQAEPEVVATLQIVYAIGWKPHHSQPQAKERGSASQKLTGTVRELR